MTAPKSSDSLLPDVPNKSEAQARCEAALKVAEIALLSIKARRQGGEWVAASTKAKEAIEQIIRILNPGG